MKSADMVDAIRLSGAERAAIRAQGNHGISVSVPAELKNQHHSAILRYIRSKVLQKLRKNRTSKEYVRTRCWSELLK